MRGLSKYKTSQSAHFVMIVKPAGNGNKHSVEIASILATSHFIVGFFGSFAMLMVLLSSESTPFYNGADREAAGRV
jgi:hypothetical protein